jgi:uncharacterized protein (DUF433 family)
VSDLAGEVRRRATARITIDPANRSGQPCIRNLRITVKDILEYLAGGMTEQEILEQFPELEHADFAAIYANPHIRNPVGFLLTAVPLCFEGESFPDLPAEQGRDETSGKS